jgi:hypothetical protein
MALSAGLYYCNECKADAHSRSGAMLVLSLAKDDPGFVDEDKAAPVDPVAIMDPSPAPSCHVRPDLLGGQNGFF